MPLNVGAPSARPPRTSPCRVLTHTCACLLLRGQPPAPLLHASPSIRTSGVKPRSPSRRHEQNHPRGSDPARSGQGLEGPRAVTRMRLKSPYRSAIAERWWSSSSSMARHPPAWCRARDHSAPLPSATAVRMLGVFTRRTCRVNDQLVERRRRRASFDPSDLDSATAFDFCGAAVAISLALAPGLHCFSARLR
jgi:hypothetical protein